MLAKAPVESKQVHRRTYCVSVSRNKSTERRAAPRRQQLGGQGKLYTDRITLTPPVLNNAARVVFMAHGAEKAPTLKAVLEGPYEPEQLPAQIIRPKEGKVLWLVDPTAASMLAPQAKGAV